MTLWLLLSLSLGACTFAATPSNQSGLRQITDWQYHWGPLTPEQLDSAEWTPTSQTLNPPDRNGEHWLWLRAPLPEITPQETLYLRGIDERFAVYLQQDKIYQFGEMPAKNAYYQGFPWHLIPLQPAYSHKYIYFQIYSQYRHSGIFGKVRIGQPVEHFQQMLFQDLEQLIVGALMIFCGLLVLLLFLGRPVSDYPLLSLFGVCMGVYLISRTELKQVYLDAPVLWKWIELIMLYLAVPAVMLFLNRIFSDWLARIWRDLIIIQVSFCIIGLILAAFGFISIQQTTQPFLWVTLVNMLLGLYVMLKSCRKHGEAGIFSLLGVLVFCLFTGYDILVSLKVLPWVRPVSHWGVLLLLVSLIFVLKRQLEGVYQGKRLAEEASRIKSEFLASFSHEVRTPLNAILGFSDLLQKYDLPKSEIEDYANTINQAGRSLLELVNDILDLTQIEAGYLKLHPTRVELKSLADEIYQLFRLLAREKSLSWQVRMSPDLPQYVELDPSKLRQILTNLAGNAFKFTDSGGVKVMIKRELIDHQMQLLIQVEDTGSGMSEEAQKHVFEPFYQIEQKNRHHLLGTGLGLAITARLMDLMQGDIHLTSVPGQGSQFLLRIPVNHWDGELQLEQEWWEQEPADNPALSELEPLLRKKLFFHLQIVLHNKSLSQIKAFVGELERLSQADHNQVLETYANHLTQALNSQDIGQINDLLARMEAELA